MGEKVELAGLKKEEHGGKGACGWHCIRAWVNKYKGGGKLDGKGREPPLEKTTGRRRTNDGGDGGRKETGRTRRTPGGDQEKNKKTEFLD